ncbi:MAG: cytidylate kinase family protein [Candidatus Bathyarchaeota archaeon]
MDLTVAINGLHGTGKSTYAKSVAQVFRLHHISAGEIFRQIASERKLSLTELSREAEKNEAIDRLIDDRTERELERGGVVVDALLAGWMARGHTALKIYLSAPFETRINRIASRDGLSYAEAEQATIVRERIERRRFKKLYGIDIDDLSIYDLILNTGLMPIEFNIEVIKTFVGGYIKSRGGN